MTSTYKTIIAASVAALVLPAAASASTIINFETGYVDDQVLSSPTELLDSTGALSGVILTAPSGSMSVEQTGSPQGDTVGFVNDTIAPNDTDEDPGADLGGFFLRTTNALSGPLNTTPVFALDFSSFGGASSVSGEIWDIDGNTSQGTESWDVVANLAGGGTAVLSSPVGTTTNGTSLNGKAWMFSFNDVGTILSIDFNFTGTKRTGIGAAVDNFEIEPVPVPAGGILLLSGLGAAALLRRRKKS